jgi:hypothetical protein
MAHSGRKLPDGFRADSTKSSRLFGLSPSGDLGPMDSIHWRSEPRSDATARGTAGRSRLCNGTIEVISFEPGPGEEQALGLR